MEKIFKKSLALVLSAALCLTALLGCLTVSAADETTTPTAVPTYAVEDVSGKPGKSVDVKVNLTDIANVCAHHLTVTFAKGLTVNTVSETAPENLESGIRELTEFTDDKGGDYKKTVATEDDGTITAGTTTIAFCDIVNFENESSNYGNTHQFIFNVKIDDNAKANEAYDVKVTAKLANIDEEFIDNFTTADGKVTVEADEPQHTFADEWSHDETNHWHACTVEGHNDVADKAAHTFGEWVIVTPASSTTEGLKKRVCEVCKYAEEEIISQVYDASVKIVGKNGLFESDYSLLYYVPTNLGDSWYIQVSIAKYNGDIRVADVTKMLTVDDVFDTTTISGNSYYRVALRGIAAKEVANEITAVLHKIENGVNYYGDALEYNLVTYATNRIKNNKVKEVAAMTAFLNYAAAAQTRFNYNTANLANKDLTEEQKIVTPVSEITSETRNDEYIVIDNATATLNGFAPSYEDKMTLVTYCKVPDNYVEAGLKIKYEYTSGSINKVEYISLADSTVFNTNYRQVSFTGLAIKEVRTPVLVTVVDNEGNAISNTRRYSFEVYAASRAENSKDYNPARAMVAFGDLFKAFKE